MEKVIIVRYSELHLKGKNRGYFERVLIINMEKALKGLKHEIKRQSGRYLVECFEEIETDEIISRLKKVFGIHSLSVALKVDSNVENIYSAAEKVCFDSGKFKVETHRADKTFPLNSLELSAEIGGRLLSKFKNLSVDVHKPQFTVNIDVRETALRLYSTSFSRVRAVCPVGTSGKGMLLISGGIDSPVAGHMILKRGMQLSCLHFHSYPYTNLQARDKVIELAKCLQATLAA